MQNQKDEQVKFDPQIAVQESALHQRVEPKCANPACPVAFHWLLGGKFFRFSDRHCETCTGKASAKSLTEKKCDGHCVKHFWLCEECRKVFMLGYQQPEGVVLRLLRTELPDGETIEADHNMAAV